MMNRYYTMEDRFLKRLEWQGECLVWTGRAGTKGGYGQITDERRRKVYVHRYAYERVHGEIPAGLVVDHICHNRRCVRIEHLRAVTPAENMWNTSGVRVDNRLGVKNVRKCGNRYWVRLQAKGVSYESVHDSLEEAMAEADRLRKEHQQIGNGA